MISITGLVHGVIPFRESSRSAAGRTSPNCPSTRRCRSPPRSFRRRGSTRLDQPSRTARIVRPSDRVAGPRPRARRGHRRVPVLLHRRREAPAAPGCGSGSRWVALDVLAREGARCRFSQRRQRRSGQPWAVSLATSADSIEAIDTAREARDLLRVADAPVGDELRLAPTQRSRNRDARARTKASHGQHRSGRVPHGPRRPAGWMSAARSPSWRVEREAATSQESRELLRDQLVDVGDRWFQREHGHGSSAAEIEQGPPRSRASTTTLSPRSGAPRTSG